MSRRAPFFLVACVLLLTGLGFVMLMSTGGYSMESARDEWAGLKRQAVWLAVGLAGAMVTMHVDYHRWQKLALPIFIGGVVLLALCFVPGIAHSKNGASRWIGVSPLIFQPSELARIGTLVALAAWCARHRDERRTLLKGFLLPLVLLALPVGLIALEVDLGSASLLFGAGAVVLYLAGARLVYMAGMVLLGAGLLYGAISLIPNRTARVTAFVHLWEEGEAGRSQRMDPAVAQLNHQQEQALIAFGAGGLGGMGLGDGRQKQHYLPLCHTDFIFPVVGEELGLGATLGTVLLFLGVAFSGLLVAAQAPDRFGKLLGAGIVLMLVYQALINMAVTTACLPNKGMPLPFISYGGSNLSCCLAAVGILLNIFRQSRPIVEQSDPVLSRPKLTPAL